MRPVTCTNCRQHIYDVHDGVNLGDLTDPADFTPARPDIPAPKLGQRIACPLCNYERFGEDLERAIQTKP